MDENLACKQSYWISLVLALTSTLVEYLIKIGMDGDLENVMAYNVVTKGDPEGWAPFMPVPFMLMSLILAIILQYRLEKDNLKFGDEQGLVFKLKKILSQTTFLSLLIVIFVIFVAFLTAYFLYPLVENVARAIVISLVFNAVFVSPYVLYIFSHQKLLDFIKKLFKK